MELRFKDNETAYEAASKVILKRYGVGESFIVQLRQKYDDFDPWEEFTVLLINEPIDPIHSKYIWETAWWEGQEFVELIAAAPVSKIRLDDNLEFKFLLDYKF